MIDQLRDKIRRGLVEYSLHATRQLIARNITPEEVAQSVLAGEVIEDYPQDKYGPSCLLLGRTLNQRVLHVQCTHPSRPLVKVITAYEPDPAEWDETWKLRK
ncbi:MAG: DUF4258 domain-containing protein [Pedosphaera sp.]|nr:DUF4258 domain-containing protein [Pedosphaera sp.]